MAAVLDQKSEEIFQIGPQTMLSRLVKFPGVFKISPSVVKITQAFWHLDHEEFNLALEQFLDPQICAEDLKAWHHQLVLNAFLAQKQYNLALMYLKVRQPPVVKVGSVYTMISLLVSNQMIEEACSFRRQNSAEYDEDKLILHLYSECNKTNQLEKIIKQKLSAKEEDLLMKYLADVKHPDSEKLKVPYYYQRSRYLDLYNIHRNSNERPGESKGLAGQQSSDIANRLLSILNARIPEITKKIIKVCQHERTVFSKSDQPLLPMSAYIHSSRDKQDFSIIHTSLVKSKELWKINESNLNDKFPFLNVPRAFNDDEE